MADSTFDDIYLERFATDETSADMDPGTLAASAVSSQFDFGGEKDSHVPSGAIEAPAEGVALGEDSCTSCRTTHVKDSLAAALDAIVQDSDEAPTEEEERTSEEYFQKKNEPPKLPQDNDEFKGGDAKDEKPDENGLVYIVRTFTVDPTKYISDNYRPKQQPNSPLPKKTMSGEGIEKEEETIAEDIPQAQEPNAKAENAAAIESKAEIKEMEEVTGERVPRKAQDEAAVFDYASYIDGSSFICFDESSGIDYSKITMDAGPRKKVTRANCETTFAQCRAENPLFCRFHGPKLIEADLRKTIVAQLRMHNPGDKAFGFTLSVTRDKDAKTPNTFRMVIGCSPSQKKHIETVLFYFFKNPGLKEVGGMEPTKRSPREWTEQFEMDILRADKPPKRDDAKGEAAVQKRDKAVEKGHTMEVVGETPESISGKQKGENQQEEPTDTETAKNQAPAEQTQPQPKEPAQEGSEEPRQGNSRKEEVQEEQKQASTPDNGGGNASEMPVTVSPDEEGGASANTAEEPKPSAKAEERQSEPPKAKSNTQKAQKPKAAENTDPRRDELVRRAKDAEGTVKELKEAVKNPVLKEGGAGSALVMAATQKALKEAEEVAKNAKDEIGNLEKDKKEAEEKSFRETERKAKGMAASSVETSLVDMAKSIFRKDSKSDSPGEEADGILKELSDFAKEKGIDYTPSEGLKELVEDIREQSGGLEAAMSDFTKYMNATGTDFHAEDIEHQAAVVGKAAKDLIDRFLKFRGLAAYDRKGIGERALVDSEKKRLKDSIVKAEGNGQDASDGTKSAKEKAVPEAKSEAKVEEPKAEAKTAEKEPVAAKSASSGNEAQAKGKGQEKLESIYKDWVEEELPEWAKELDEKEALEYAALLEEARDHGSDEGSTAFERLDAFETSHKNEERKKEAEVKKQKHNDEVQANRPQLEAARRLGLDAYKPTDDLKRMLDVAKRHSSDPRMVQRAKDIETILADRKSKEGMPEHEGGKYVGDESPELIYDDLRMRKENMQKVLGALVKALED